MLGLAFAAAGVVQATWAVTAAIALAIVGTLGLVVYSYQVWRHAATR